MRQLLRLGCHSYEFGLPLSGDLRQFAEFELPNSCQVHLKVVAPLVFDLLTPHMHRIVDLTLFVSAQSCEFELFALTSLRRLHLSSRDDDDVEEDVPRDLRIELPPNHILDYLQAKWRTDLRLFLSPISVRHVALSVFTMRPTGTVHLDLSYFVGVSRLELHRCTTLSAADSLSLSVRLDLDPQIVHLALHGVDAVLHSSQPIRLLTLSCVDSRCTPSPGISVQYLSSADLDQHCQVWRCADMNSILRALPLSEYVHLHVDAEVVINAHRQRECGVYEALMDPRRRVSCDRLVVAAACGDTVRCHHYVRDARSDFNAALCAAVAGGFADIVALLLDSGRVASVNERDARQCTPLYYAVSSPVRPVSLEILQMLLARGADPTRPSLKLLFGGSALHILLDWGDQNDPMLERMVGALLPVSDVDLPDANDVTPLGLCRGHLRQVLVQARA